MLILNNVKVNYKEKVALNLNREIQIEDGDRVGIIGSNGAGKTTLIKSILGLVDYTGSIKLDINPEDIAVHMQQNEYSELVPVKYVMEAILGEKLESNKEVMEMIEFFSFKDSLKKKFKHLSGGQKQRLTLILVMCQNSQITMFDEVTSGLDFETRQRLMDKLVEWYSTRETTLLITSHYYTELENLVNKILLLDNGKVIDFGNKDELFRKYCGNSVIIFSKKNTRGIELNNYKVIDAANDEIAVSCKNSNEESEVVKILSERNINYRRSNNDIEVMTVNAKLRYYGEA